MKYSIPNVKTHDTNPFWDATIIDTKEVIKGYSSIVNLTQTKKLETKLAIVTTGNNDREYFSKIYDNAILYILTLKETERKLLAFIATRCLEFDSGVFMFHIEKYMDDEKVSRTVAYRALQGLIKAQIIARKTNNSNYYFVNPAIIFKGDRIEGRRKHERYNAQVIANATSLESGNGNNRLIIDKDANNYR